MTQQQRCDRACACSGGSFARSTCLFVIRLVSVLVRACMVCWCITLRQLIRASRSLRRCIASCRRRCAGMACPSCCRSMSTRTHCLLCPRCPTSQRSPHSERERGHAEQNQHDSAQMCKTEKQRSYLIFFFSLLSVPFVFSDRFRVCRSRFWVRANQCHPSALVCTSLPTYSRPNCSAHSCV